MILGLSGYARSGKDTVAEYLVQKYDFVRMSFADPIREAVYRLDPLVSIGEMRGVSLANAVDKMGWEVVKDLSPDVRGLLQRMGTEVGREMFGEDFWVDQAMLRAMKEHRVVFADVRFANEAHTIGRHWGYNWRVNRPGVGPANDHISETQLDEYNLWDAVLDNDSSVKDLHKKVDALMEEING